MVHKFRDRKISAQTAGIAVVIYDVRVHMFL